MLGENIRILRKRKGLSQEALALRLNVVRQTVSKWEKGISVPDAELLNTLSELLETPVSTLLGSTVEEEKTAEHGIEEMAKQLAALNDQLAAQAARRRRFIKRLLIGIPIALLLLIACWYALFWHYRVEPRRNAVLRTSSVTATLNGETYSYMFTYDENFRIREAGGDAWIANHVMVDRFDDANVALAQIEDYFTDRGGTVEITQEPCEGAQ